MRILLLTDSLGCPRSETPVSETWTEKFINHWGSNNTVYTYCRHGLSAKMIDLEYLKEINPDIIISQFGIVDACRRALTSRELKVVSKIPFLGNYIKTYCHNHHYKITKRRNVHYCYLPEFISVVNSIKNIANDNKKFRLIFIKICSPGTFMRESVYNIDSDVLNYNKAVSEISEIILVDPYENSIPDDILLNDGHHLNSKGHVLVSEQIDKIMNEIIGGE